MHCLLSKLCGKPGIAGSANMPHTHTYIPDFGKALVILGERSEADGMAWHVPKDLPRITQGEFVQMVADEAGIIVKIPGSRKFTMSLLGMFVPEVKELVQVV